MWSLLLVLPALGSVCAFTKRNLEPASISRSFVNLGKMDISFYFNTKNDQVKRSNPSHYEPSYTYYSKPDPVSSCPCYSLRNLKESLLNPSDIINKILSSNDLFRTSDDLESAACCNSPDIHEETYIIDLTKPKSPASDLLYPNPSTILTLPTSFDGYLQQPEPQPEKHLNDFEFFFFPPKQDFDSKPQNKKNKKASIKSAGNKNLKKYPSESTAGADKVNESVKKDLKIENPEINTETTLPEQNRKEKTTIAVGAGDTNTLD